MKIFTESEAENLNVLFDFKHHGHFKSVAGLKRSVKAQEKEGGFSDLQCAYFFEEENWRGDDGFSLCFGILPPAGEPTVYRQAINAFGQTDLGVVTLPRTKDKAWRDLAGKWVHKFANGDDMPADQWRERALSQLEA